MALSASDLQTVYSLLVNSLSADEAVRKPAEATLAQCENRPGFCSCLLVAPRTLSLRLRRSLSIRVFACLFGSPVASVVCSFRFQNLRLGCFIGALCDLDE